MKIYIINGYTKNIGSWEVELFNNKAKALNMFLYYVSEYNATYENTLSYTEDLFAKCDDGWFCLEEREV